MFAFARLVDATLASTLVLLGSVCAGARRLQIHRPRRWRPPPGGPAPALELGATPALPPRASRARAAGATDVSSEARAAAVAPVAAVAMVAAVAAVALAGALGARARPNLDRFDQFRA